MILLVDSYDSFVYDLVRGFEQLGKATRVVRNTAINVAGVRQVRLRPSSRLPAGSWASA